MVKDQWRWNVVVYLCEFRSNFARDRGGAIAARGQSTILYINETNFHNNTANWGSAISSCNSQTEVYHLQSARDPIYTHCTTYDGYIDYITADTLQNCSIV